jgi:hypothetical protein
MLERAIRRVDGWLTDVPFYPWLLALFPVLRLYMENLTDVATGEVVLPVLIVLLATTGGMVVTTRLMHDRRRAAIVVSAILVPTLTFGLVLELLPSSLDGARYPLLVLTLGLVVLAVFVALRITKRLGTLTSALNIVSLALVIVVAVPGAPGVADALRIGDSPINDPVVAIAAGADASPERDIYHIILDRYGSERALRTGYRIDNAEFVDWLRGRGFQVLDDAHANYAWTTLSMASTLEMSHLDSIAQASGPDSQNMGPIDRRLAENRAGAFLQDLGYDYTHMGAWFPPTRDSDIADLVFHPTQKVDFMTMLTELSVLPMLLGQADPVEERTGRTAGAVIYELGQLDDISDLPGPKYVLAHILLPHPPYVFLEDGTVAPEAATFRTQLAFTNASLKRFLEPLLERPEDERPIIILQADEGPYPRRFGWHAAGFDAATATDDELITKFGILSAWFLPGPEGAAPLDPAMTAINTYRELFRRYFGSDVADAPDRVFMSLKDRPYDLVDITDRLAAAEQRLVTKAAAPADAAAVPDASPTAANGDASAAGTSSA